MQIDPKKGVTLIMIILLATNNNKPLRANIIIREIYIIKYIHSQLSIALLSRLYVLRSRIYDHNTISFIVTPRFYRVIDSIASIFIERQTRIHSRIRATNG